MTDKKTPRIFSGVQPSGGLHLGNYLGAIRHFVRLQDTHQCFYGVVDLHALTNAPDPAELAANSREVAAAFIAAGIDVRQHNIFAQSQVPQHTELAWILECVARVGWLSRMTQFKEKAGKHSERMSVGLYVYPVLMAADILLYRATAVPVGDDQKQHLELARDIAQKFNNDYAGGEEGEEFFPLPEPLIAERSARVMSLRDASKKMSKSDASAAARIELIDDADTIAHKIKKAKTDVHALPDNPAALEGREEAKNLLELYAELGDEDIVAVLETFGGKSFAELKSALSERLIAQIVPLGDEMRRLLAEPQELDKILAAGAAAARVEAEQTMVSVRKLVGFIGG